MKNLFFVLVPLLLILSSCEKEKNKIVSQTENIISSESMEGIWILKSIQPSFPTNAPHIQVPINEKYHFDPSNLNYKHYIDDKLIEEGKFNITMSTNSSSGKMSIIFLNDESTSTLIFKEGMLIMGSRIPKGDSLIDYEDYYYYSRIM